MFACMCLCMCLYVCMCVCMYVCVYVSMYVRVNVCTGVYLYVCMNAREKEQTEMKSPSNSQFLGIFDAVRVFCVRWTV